ncbi:MAG: hypothetical protein ACIAXF_07880 [Phycisphaerales bacterium JB063]
MLPLRWMICSLLLLGIGAVPLHAQIEETAEQALDRFYADRYDTVDAERYAYLERNAEDIIRRFPDHPGLPQLMYTMAGNAQVTGFYDWHAARKWYERAALQSEPGSEMWYDMRLQLASWLMIEETDEAERWVDEVEAAADPYDTLTRIRVERRRMALANQRHDTEQALHHAHRVMDWYDLDWEHNYPAEGDRRTKIDVDTEIRHTGYYVINSMYRQNPDLTPEQKIAGIQAVMARQRLLQSVQSEGRRAVRELREQLGQDVDDAIGLSMAHILAPPPRGLPAPAPPVGQTAEETLADNELDDAMTGISQVGPVDPVADSPSAVGSTSIPTSTRWWLIAIALIAIALIAIVLIAGYLYRRRGAN